MISLWWIRLLIVTLVSIGLVAGYSWFVKHQRQIGYDRRTAEYTVQENKDLKAALAETIRLNNVIKEAENEAKKRDEANRVLSVRNASLLGKLRDTDARINELVSSATDDALRNATQSFTGLFADCRAGFETMGRAAAGHRSDVIKYQASWPVKEQ